MTEQPARERLSEEQLDRLIAHYDEMIAEMQPNPASSHGIRVRCALAELRERRALDPQPTRDWPGAPLPSTEDRP